MDFLPALLAIAVAGLLGIVLLCKVWGTPAGKGRLAPEPHGAWPFIGHLHLLRGQTPLFRTLGGMADKLGPVFMIRLGMRRALVVSGHEAVKECFTTNDKVFVSRPRSSVGKVLGYNYAAFGFAPYGPLWREMRKFSVMEILAARRLDSLKHVQVSELDICIKELYSLGKESNWVSPIKVTMSEWLQQLTFNVVLRMIAEKRYFGNDAQGNEEARLAIATIKKFISLTGAFVASDLIPFLEWMDLQGYLGSMKRVAKELDSLVGSWVEEHAMKLKRREPSSSSRRDFIDVMLSELKEHSMFGHERETVIKATVLTLIVAGSDTTSYTSKCLLSALLKNEKALNHAQEELDQKVGRGRQVEESDIKNLVYLQAIVKETLRLYAPPPLSVPHEALEDCCVGGYHVPKGTRLLVNTWKLHRDPNVWSDPEEFQPERFLTSHADLDVLGQNFELIPFGSGRRSCPGITLALKMLHLTIARLLQGFEITTPLNNAAMNMTGQDINIRLATSLEVMITPRLPAHLY